MATFNKNQRFAVENASCDSNFSVLMASSYAVISALFLLNGSLGLSWRFAWVAFGATVICSIISSALRLIRFETLRLDAFLLSLSLLFIAIIQPFVFAINGFDFPYAWQSEIKDDNVANGTGAILSVFLSAYFAGRIFFTTNSRIEKNVKSKKCSKVNLKFSTGLVFFFSIISTYPFFAFGTAGIVQNLMSNITGRQTGYVAFSEGAMGSSDPISVLIAQLIPVTVMLNAVLAATEKKFYKKIVHILLFLFLFFLLISLGGRTWVVIVALTLLSVVYFNSKTIKARVLFFWRMALISILIIGTLEYQIKQRHQGIEGASSSGLVGSDINREIAFIYDIMSTRDGFVIADNILEKIVMPIPTYIFFVITNPIPRIIWSDKPFDPSFVYVNELRTGQTGLETGSNITITIPGRAYVNFGWSGVIQHAFVLGFILSRLSRKISHVQPGSAKRIIYIFIICLIAVNVRELQAGKFYPIFWIFLIAWSQRFLSQLSS
tara:strand:- start:5189 stop:6664 length:1476 start_codon:yes stop_codon:yes gene_type:complete